MTINKIKKLSSAFIIMLFSILAISLFATAKVSAGLPDEDKRIINAEAKCYTSSTKQVDGKDYPVYTEQICSDAIDAGYVGIDRNIKKACYVLETESVGGTTVKSARKIDCAQVKATGKNPPPEDAQASRNVTGDKAAFESCPDIANCNFVNKFVNPAIKFLSAGVGLIVTIMIIVAGIQYSSSGGDPQKAAAARGKVINALIALVTYIFFFALLVWLWPGKLL